MIHLYFLSALWPILTAALAVGASNGARALEATDAVQDETRFIGHAFIVECEKRSDVESLTQEVKRLGGTIRHSFTSDTFLGLSAQLPVGNGRKTDDFHTEMKTRSGIKDVWPVATVKLPAEATAEISELQEDLQRRHSQRFKARDTEDKTPWNHLMTQVDKLHAEGFTGKGVKIGIVDTGVSSSSCHYMY